MIAIAEEHLTYKPDMEKFRNPPASFRPTPFWAVNDRLDVEEVRRQVSDMSAVGLGGVFFHSRHGLVTEYMSDEWFEALRGAIESAKTSDALVWLYDEDLWPSGNAGGRVAGTCDEYRAAVLQAEFLPTGVAPSADGEDEFVIAYRLTKRQGAVIDGAEIIDRAESEADLTAERVVFRRRYADKTNWWSGESYSNLLNPDAVREFLASTHQKYASRIGDEFGKSVPGIFTDEPQISQGFSGIPWERRLPDVYGEWQGRDFWADLPYLFFEGPESRKIRLLMHRTILRKFCQSYSAPVYKWCDEHSLALTGHFNAEDTFCDQIQCHCGGIMSHYRYMHVPGVDHLCRQIEGMGGTYGSYLAGLLTVKQVASVARQMGRPRVLSEIFGVTRHTNTFEDFKWLGDFEIALGINFLCPHLSLYSTCVHVWIRALNRPGLWLWRFSCARQP